MNLRAIIFVSIVIISLAGKAVAQSIGRQKEPKAIQDNSFLVEEAFNQEEGVVQHISNWMYVLSPQHDFVFSFTQEWPLSGQAHQLSFTIPFTAFNSFAIQGLGDVMVHYRYQMFSGDDGVDVAPRLSVILPTGNKVSGTGSGVVGFQTSIPLSKELSQQWIAHVNVGLTIVPNVSSTTVGSQEVTRSLVSPSFGGSIIWLADPTFNLMIESVLSSNARIDDHGSIIRERELIVSPGLRFAINIPPLQIVPGIAIPLNFRQSGQRTALFFYLSFEHPY